MYKDLDLNVCKSYNDIYSFPFAHEKNKGFGRENLSHTERLVITNNACPPPCSKRHYEVESMTTWEGFTNEKSTSLQVAFADFVTRYKEEYFSCDMTCIIGEVGGNLGFFLGGSILMCLDISIEVLTFVVQKAYRYINGH